MLSFGNLSFGMRIRLSPMVRVSIPSLEILSPTLMEQVSASESQLTANP